MPESYLNCVFRPFCCNANIATIQIIVIFTTVENVCTGRKDFLPLNPLFSLNLTMDNVTLNLVTCLLLHFQISLTEQVKYCKVAVEKVQIPEKK